MTALLPLLLGLALASPSEPRQEPAPAKQSDARQQPVPVGVEVDVSALPETEDIGGALRDHQVKALTEGGFVVTDDAETTIRITVSRWGDGSIHYRFVVSLTEPGGSAPTVERDGTCELCTESELYTKVSEEVARVSGRLLFVPEPEPEPEREPEREPEPEPQTPDDAKVRRIGGAGWAGIGLAVAGLATTAGGVVVLASPQERMLAPGDDRNDRIADRQPLGGALLGVGLGVLATGAVLFAVDQTVLVQRRHERARATSLAPTLLPSGVGLTLGGRF